MPKRLKYEGKVYQFPDEATEEQIVSFLQENAPQPDKTVTRRAEENLANLKTENPFNRTKSLYAGAPDADRSPGLGDYLDEKLLSAEKAIVGSVPVGIAKSLLSLPAGMASSTGRSIGGETFSQDKSYAFPTRSDQDIALEQPVVRGLGPKKGMAPLLFAGGAYGEAPQTGAPADIAKIGPVDPFNLSEEAAFYRDWQRPPERIENYDQWLAQQDLATRISPIKNGDINPHALKNLLGSAVESAPQMATILGASWLGGPGAGAVAGSALGAGNAGADTARYEAERGFSNPDAAMTAALGGIASGATEAIPIGDMLKRGGAAALKPGFWNAVRQAGVNTGKNALEEMPQELTQNYIEAMTAADPSRRMEYDISDPGAFAGRQLEIAAKAGLTSAGFSSVTEAPNLYRGARAKPADIIEGRDGATGMQPVDMKVPVEKGPSAAVAPNPDRSARVVPADTPVPVGMAFVRTEDGILIYDPEKPGARVAAKAAVSSPEGLEAFLAEHGAKPTMAPFVPRDEPAPRPPKLDGTEDGLYTAALSAYKYATEAIEADPELSPEQKRDALAKRKMAYDARVAELDTKYAPYRAPVEPQPPQSSYFDTIPPEGIRITPQQQRDRERSMIANNSELTPEMKEELLSRLPTSVEPQPAQKSYFDTLPPGGVAPTDAERRAYERSRVMGDAALSPEQKEEALARLSAEEAAAAPLGQRSYFDIRAQKDAEAAAVQQAAAEKAEAARIAALPPPPPEPSPLDLALEQGVSPEPARVVPPFAQSLLRGVKPQPKPQEPSIPYEEFADALPSVETAIMRQATQDLAPAPPPVAAQPRQMKDLIATPKAPAKVPKPAPVAKEAPVAQPAQQPKAVATEPKKTLGSETNEEYKARILAAKEAKAAADAAKAKAAVTTPVSDQKAAAAFTPVQLKQAEQLVRLAYQSEKTADGPTERTQAEREVEREEKRAREMGIDVDAISRSVGREPTGSDGNALPTVAKVVPESVEVTPQVTIETSPFMQARRAAEAAAAKEAKPEPKKEPKPKSPEAKAAEKAQKGKAEFNTPKTVEKKLAAAVAKEKALRAKRDADPENEALLDEYNEATAELYALTKEANGKGVSTLDVTTDDDTPSLMKTLPQREARAEAFGNKPTMTREAFDKALEDAKKRLPGIAHLVDALNSQADLPASVAAVANGDRIDGFTQNGRVAVVADGMTSPEHVAATLAHEAVGHLVPEAVFGKNEWRKRLNDMMASSQWFRDFVANFGKSEIGSRYKAAELASEAVAFEANRVLDDANYKPPNAYRMFIAKLREWLREAVGARRVIGLSKVLEFSDRDLAAFIARSKRTAEKGLPQNRRKGDGKPSFAKGPSTGYVDLAQDARTDTDSEADPFQLDTINEWLTVDRAKAALADPLSLARGVRDAVKNPRLAYEAVHRKMADRFYIFDKAEKEAKRRGATGDISMYRAEDERHGKTATEIEDVNSQFVDPIIKIANENDVSLDDIGEWLYASHAYRRNAEGRKRDPKNDAFSGMTDIEADAILDRLKGKSKALDEIAERVYSMLDYERKRIVEAGLATKEDVDGWAKTWGPLYVPLKHQEADTVRSGNASGFSALKKVAKSATGRYTLADNPLTNAVSQVERTIKRAHDAEVGRELLRFFEANPNPDLWVVNPKPKKKTLKTTKDEDGNFETTVKEVAEPTFLRDDILNVKVNGENVEVQIKHPDMLRAAKRAFENEQSGEFIKAIGEFSRLYGGLLTMYNMEFWLTNPIRDVQTAAANMSIGYGKDKAGKSQMVKTAAKVAGNFGKAARGVVRFMRDPNSNDEYAVLYKQMRKEGATVGWSPFEDPKAVEKRLSANMNAIKRGGMDPRTWATKAAKLVHDVNTVAETATRLSVYKMLGDAGITGRERVQIVKNSTVNFNRKGEAGPLFNSLYLFGNVGIQGPVAMAKFAARNKKAAAGVAGSLFAVGMAQTFLNQMFAGDDDDDGYSNYDEMQESTKARNWIIGKSSIPMGHGWSFFVNAGRYAAETLSGKKTPAEAAVATATNFIDSFNPMGTSGSFVQALTPTIGDPFVQHAENKTAFESPIYPTPTGVPGDSLKPDSQRYFRSAPQWAVKTAEKLNKLSGGDKSTKGFVDVSPETLQFASDWATQGLPKLLMRMASFAGNTLSGEKTRTGDIPFVRRFRTDEHPSLDRGRYIRQRDELEWKFRSAKAYKDGPEKDLAKYDALLSGPLRSRSDFNSIQKLYARLDDVEQTPAVEALKDRLIGVASRQFEIAKKPVKYSPLDAGLLDSLDEAVETLAPKTERESTNEEILEDLEGR